VLVWVQCLDQFLIAGVKRRPLRFTPSPLQSGRLWAPREFYR